MRPSIIIPNLTVCLFSAYPPRERCIYFPAERGGLTLANKSLMLGFYSNMGATHSKFFGFGADERLASSIKELAVFLFYLRCVAKKGETVVLEEPETALYPENQIQLARLVARLVNAGLNIIITTHSPYFLEQLSHCVMAGSSETGKKLREFPNGERLDKDKVAAYGFREYDGGYEIMPIPVDDEGIPQSDFVAASESQYNELIRLET